MAWRSGRRDSFVGTMFGRWSRRLAAGLEGLLLGFFFLLLVLSLGADFFGPYSAAEQERDIAYAPPTPIRFLVTPDANIWPPSIDSPKPGGTAVPIRFFVPAEEPEDGWFGRRLFGVPEPTRLSLLGRDGLGRDQFTRLLHGTRLSLLAGLLATWTSLLLALPLGTLAGYAGGRLDELLMRTTELFMAIPWLFLLLVVRALLPISLAPESAFLLTSALVGAIGWALPARLVRNAAAEASQRPFVLAANGLGAPPLRIMIRHVLPRSFSVALTHATVLLPQFILAEVTLSYLGLGITDPMVSLGTLLSPLQEHFHLVCCPWMLWPAAALALVVLGLHQIANTFQARSSPFPR